MLFQFSEGRFISSANGGRRHSPLPLCPAPSFLFFLLTHQPAPELYSLTPSPDSASNLLTSQREGEVKADPGGIQTRERIPGTLTHRHGHDIAYCEPTNQHLFTMPANARYWAAPTEYSDEQDVIPALKELSDEWAGAQRTIEQCTCSPRHL